MISQLHVHSYYSLLHGLNSISNLIQAASEQGSPALALTDRYMLTGSIEFYLACREAGIKPLIGMEIDLGIPSKSSSAAPLDTKGTLLLLAQDRAGWQNLCRLSSTLLESAGTSSPIGSLELLDQHADGLLCLSGGSRSLLNQAVRLRQPDEFSKLLASLNQIFPQRLYIELQKHFSDDADVNMELSRLAANYKIPVAATHTVDYLRADQNILQSTIAAIRLNCNRTQLKADQVALPGSYYLLSNEFEARFKPFPAALAGMAEIVERCNLEIPLGISQYPAVPLPPGMTVSDLLRRHADEGALKLYKKIEPHIRQRLDEELAVIAARHYEPIFLIVEELLCFARENGIIVSSRGSAASSLVAHCLEITSPDPLEHNLYFERFLNPARLTPPDIDTDICSRRRDELIQHVFNQYGDDRVAMVGTINRFRPRSALGDVAKAHGFSSSEIRTLTRTIPYRFGPPPSDDEKSNEEQDVFHELKQQHPSERYKPVFQEAAALLDFPRHLSVHVGGIVIAPGLITDWVPVQRSGAKDIRITQLDLDFVEKIGLVKIDLLGIRGLTVLSDVAGKIHSWNRREYANPSAVLDAVPPDDPETSQLVFEGKTIGCFQIESPGMRTTLRDIQARTIDDIIRALALYRPGPLKGGLRDAYVRRHLGQEPVAHIHPSLAPLLDETYGVVLYQEQVLRIAHELAGLSLAESDLLRRAMSHFDPGKQMQVLKEKFIAGSAARSGVDPENAERIWELMASFAGYGFPKAHAASYALVSWRSAWCKAHFPAEFIGAVLANWGGYYSQRVYLGEARRLGLQVCPPHVNHSQGEFSVAYPDGSPTLYMGLSQVRDLTTRTMQRILRGRPFQTFADFTMKVDPRPKEIQNLIMIGAFDGMGTIPTLLHQLTGRASRAGQLSLFPTEVHMAEDDWDLIEKVQAQQQILGLSVNIHPLELFPEQLEKAKVISTIAAADCIGKTVRVAGVRQSWRRSRPARGGIMAFLTIEDLDGTLDVVIFPAVYQRYRNELLSATAPYIIEGTLVEEANQIEPVLHATKIWRLE